MQAIVPELVTDALSLRADLPIRAAEELVRITDPRVALHAALVVIIEQKRELASITDELEDLQADHERLAGKTLLWLATHPDLDPEAVAELEDIIEDNL